MRLLVGSVFINDLVGQVVASKLEGHAEHDNILLVICKCLHLAVRSQLQVPSNLVDSFDLSL